MSKKRRAQDKKTKVEEEVAPAQEKESIAKSLVKDIAVAVIIVLIIIASLYGYAGRWPPLVVIESGSMSHGEEAIPQSKVGTIDAGDLVIIKTVDGRGDIITYVEGEKIGYERYGEYGDVILYYKNGYQDTPIIHRAIVWIDFNDDNYDEQNKTGWAFDVPSLGITGETGNITIDSVGYDGIGITINLRNIFYVFINNHEKPHGGFITLGDHNRHNFDQNGAYINSGIVGGLRDMNGNPVQLVKMDWVIGVARGEIPWFGAIKLYNTPSHQNIPDNSWTNLKASIAVMIAVPLLLDVVIYLFERRKNAAK